MSWNGNDNKDPWGRNDTPPEIDEVIKKVREKVDSIFGGGSSGGSSSGGGFSMRNLPLILGVLVLLWVGAGIYQVEQAERSVVLRLGKFEEIKGPGLRWNPPIIDAWEIVDVVRVRPHRHDALMLTKDENIVAVTVSVQYQIADPQKYVLDISMRNLPLILGVLVLLWVGAGIYQVEQAERSVVLRLGKFEEIKGPGLRWNPPIIDAWEIVDVVRVRPHRHDALMLTKDENIVAVTVSVQYQIADPQKYVLDIRDADASLVQATESALRHVVGGSIMDDALTTGRELIAQEVKTRLQRYLNKYNTGLEVVIVNIEDSSPPNQVQEAFDDVIKAREDEVRARNEAETYANGLVPEARGEAQRMLQDAEAYKEQVVAEAQGDATRFNLLLKEYQKAPDVTRNRLYLDSIQAVMSNSTKVMIDVEGGNNILYLPLDKIAESARGVESLNIPSGSNNSSSIRDLTNQVIEEIRRRNRQEERR